MSEKKTKLFGPLEIVVFIAVVILLAYIGMKGGGGSIIERSENVEIIDNPSYKGGEKKVRPYQSTENDESVESILHQIADQYANGTVDFKAKKKLEKAGITEDEMAFLNTVKEEKKQKTRTSSTDWFSLLRTSHKTYTKVKSVFEKAGIDVDAAENDVTSTLVNEVAARSFYSKMEQMFNIPEKDAKAFAKKGENALSDWARFVEDNTQ